MKKWAVVNKVKRYQPGAVEAALDKGGLFTLLNGAPFTLEAVPDTPKYVKTFFFKWNADRYCSAMNYPPSPINQCVVERI